MLDHFVSDDSLKVKCELDLEEGIEVDADDDKVLYPVINIKTLADEEPPSPAHELEEKINFKREPELEEMEDFDMNFDDVFQNYEQFEEFSSKPSSGMPRKKRARIQCPGKHGCETVKAALHRILIIILILLQIFRKKMCLKIIMEEE